MVALNRAWRVIGFMFIANFVFAYAQRMENFPQQTLCVCALIVMAMRQ